MLEMIQGLIGQPAGLAVWTMIKILLIVLPLLGCVAYLTLAERKIIGWMQIRIGPNRVGPLGLLQPIADAVKAMFKEIILPTQANKSLFVFAPILSIAPALAAWAVVPFYRQAGTGKHRCIVVVHHVDRLGWGCTASSLPDGHPTRSTSFLGAMRSAAQMVSYEIAMGLR